MSGRDNLSASVSDSFRGGGGVARWIFRVKAKRVILIADWSDERNNVTRYRPSIKLLSLQPQLVGRGTAR